MNVVLCLPTYAAQNPVLQRITGFYAMTTITHKTLKLPRPKKEAHRGPGIVTLTASICTAGTGLILWEDEN